MHKFNKWYYLLAVLILLIEVLIAGNMHDALIRPYGGDFLVVIMIYCFVKAFLSTPVFKTACAVLVFAYIVEFSQYFHLVRVIGLGHSKIALLFLGDHFSVYDLLAYTLGILLIIFTENIRLSLKTF